MINNTDSNTTLKHLQYAPITTVKLFYLRLLAKRGSSPRSKLFTTATTPRPCFSWAVNSFFSAFTANPTNLSGVFAVTTIVYGTIPGVDTAEIQYSRVVALSTSCVVPAQHASEFSEVSAMNGFWARPAQ